MSSHHWSEVLYTPHYCGQCPSIRPLIICYNDLKILPTIHLILYVISISSEMFKSLVKGNAKDVAALKFMILSVVLTVPHTAMNVKQSAGEYNCSIQ